MNLPADLLPGLYRELADVGDRGEILQAQPVSGGGINHAVRLQTVDRTYLLKWNTHPLPGQFTQEAIGLKLLAATHTVRTPEILAVADEDAQDTPAFILLEYVEPPIQSGSYWDAGQLGVQLASLHHQTAMVSAQRFGLAQDNYIGSSTQPNGWCDDWIIFFREKRLRHQSRMAEKNGRLTPTRRKQLDRLLDQLPQFVGKSHQPSLVHGDLWSGNVIPDHANQPVLIDPAVYYGNREVEIAYTELFGGFPDRFYQAYNHTWPLEPGYPERRDLYNLYHLLNHLNIFGEAYGGQVDAILRYYVG